MVTSMATCLSPNNLSSQHVMSKLSMTERYMFINQSFGLYWRISARGLHGTDRAQQEPCKKDQPPIFFRQVFFMVLNWAPLRMIPCDHSCVFSDSFIGYFSERTYLRACKLFLRPNLFPFIFLFIFWTHSDEKICLVARLKFVVSFQLVIVAFFQNFQNIFSRGINLLLTELARDCTWRILSLALFCADFVTLDLFCHDLRPLCS